MLDKVIMHHYRVNIKMKKINKFTFVTNEFHQI